MNRVQSWIRRLFGREGGTSVMSPPLTPAQRAQEQQDNLKGIYKKPKSSLGLARSRRSSPSSN